jgi:hypothetical protein
VIANRSRRVISRLAAAAFAMLAALPAWAGDADVTDVVIRQRDGLYDLDVTIRSNDTGWERYADRIEAVAPDGGVLGTRVLEHPHDDEQPFTRDLYQLRVPAGISHVTVRAHFKPTGYDGVTMTVALPGR